MGKKRGAGATKKRHNKNERQKEIRLRRMGGDVDLKEEGCNQLITCDVCNEKQRNRAFCYFCKSLQRLPQCAECTRTKCPGTDCVVPHAGRNVTGTGLVAAICDFCEAWVCHSRRCLEHHACRCPLQDAVCCECDRGVWEHGGRIFRCASCDAWICEDDQFEHQASCQVLDAETDHCISCNKKGTWTCVRCKICFCDTHVKSKLNPVKKGEAQRCKRCGHEVQEANALSMSLRKHDFGRQTHDVAQSGYYANRGMGSAQPGPSQGPGAGSGDEGESNALPDRMSNLAFEPDFGSTDDESDEDDDDESGSYDDDDKDDSSDDSGDEAKGK